MTNKCLSCKMKSNRPIIVKQKYSEKGKDLIKEIQIQNIYRCDCGKSVHFGNLEEKYINKENPIILDKVPSEYFGVRVAKVETKED